MHGLGAGCLGKLLRKDILRQVFGQVQQLGGGRARRGARAFCLEEHEAAPQRRLQGGTVDEPNNAKVNGVALLVPVGSNRIASDGLGGRENIL